MSSVDRKPQKKLLEELVEVARIIKDCQSLRGGVYNSMEFANVLTYQDTNKTWKEILENEQASHTAYWGYLSTLKRKGYMCYTPKKRGGTGWTVNSSYLVGTSQEIKTTIIDRTANIASKIGSAKTYSDCLHLIQSLVAADKTVTLVEFLAFLTQHTDYRALATRPDNAGEETRHIQQELEKYGLELAVFRSGYDADASRAHTQEIRGVNLWQLYRLLQVVEAEPLAKPTTPTTSECVDVPNEGQELSDVKVKPIIIEPSTETRTEDWGVSDDERPFQGQTKLLKFATMRAAKISISTLLSQLLDYIKHYY